MPLQTYDPEGTVETIVDNGLCTECGFCEPICPTRAIKMVEDPQSREILPKVDPALCVMCPLCLTVCPGETVDFDKYFQEYIGTNSYEKYTGYIERTYLGWSTDQQRRHGAASGGVLFELAHFALESRQIDYLIFAKARDDNPFRSETILTNRPEDLEGASGSIYYPVPLGESLDKLLNENISPSAKLGLIGLPCHIHGAHKTFGTGKFKKFSWEMIFGVFCGGTWSYKAVDQYLETKKLSRGEVATFAFRGGGWPGKITLTTKNGDTIEEERHKPAITDRINKGSIFSANSFYTPHRCFTCSDGLADLADISFGDPWLKSQKGERHGKTLIVTRNEKALRLLISAKAAGVIELEQVDNELAIVSQKSMLTVKQNFQVFNKIIGLITGRRTPRYEYKWLRDTRPPRALYVWALASYLCHLVARRTDSKYLRIPLATIRGIIARFTKNYLVRLTPRDNENYFS